MKVIGKIKTTLLSIKESIKRFPITISISTILAFLLIYLNESNLTGDSKITLEKISLVLGIGILLSLCIGLLIESFFQGKKHISLLLYALGATYLVLYYFIFLDSVDSIAMARYVGHIIFLLLAFFYIPRLNRDEKYEYYVMDVFSSIALTFIYSFVLYFGIAAIIFTINQLFDANIRGQIFFYMFLLVVFVFAVSLFLSKIPPINVKYGDNIYTKSLNILLLYIVIPLITIYTGILYVYFAKILLTRSWPRGLVSHLVLWYSTVSVGVIFLITPILNENRLAKFFKTWFPKIILPILLMMFASIYLRVNQYGVTENRYYLIALGIWVFGIMLYFSFKKPLKNIVIPISLSIVVLNSIFGPFSSFAISKSSQNKRLENILIKNNMLVNGEIKKNPDIPVEDKREISNIISYFSSHHELDDLRSLPKDFQTTDMDKLIGFKYEPSYPGTINLGQYFNYHTNLMDAVLDISGFDFYLNISSWNDSTRTIGDLTIEYMREQDQLIIMEGNDLILDLNIKDLVEDIHFKLQEKTMDNRKGFIDYEDMSYSIRPNNREGIEIKLIFTDVNGRIDEIGNVLTESVEFILLVKNQ